MKKYKKFYHLYGNIEVKREGEIEVQKLFASKEEAEAEMDRLELKHESSPNLIRFNIKYDICSLQEIFGIYTVEEICAVDEDFERLIRVNIDDLTRIKD
ncbi:hypothetical protein ACQKMZ_28670 [Bacillus paramycoides]|uniref:hypothetical protein n=1 Tax=Bacillus paramycoides TaxID=2026194 RepID=UPI003D01F3DF